MAKFEVCCHKFADLSEHKYGISIPNDSKYGFSTVGNVMCLSLLRSPKAPDGNADMGRHRIRWAMIPHRGGLGAQTVRAAFNFNNPLRLVATPKGRPNVLPNAPIALTGDHNLVLDWIKRGEDDEDVSLDDLPKRKSKSVVVRVYDAVGGSLEERSRRRSRWTRCLRRISLRVISRRLLPRAARLILRWSFSRLRRTVFC
ncbi:hypothetical protein BJF96_g388 [Verticillium dahliae]|uniref:Glycosyl hydrolase family 38 C-terminal domain-containing protein n=1 Tax=Verticillium dahliae TaxID=27337 RepID=A0AA44WU95_VERDA|nr:hypothetical protein BJF96_g388 [Verticillium dahliae]